MLHEIMDHFGLSRELRNPPAYFETEQNLQVFKEIRSSVKLGKLIALSGIVGCGKTVTLRRIQEALREEKEILVSKSLSVDKARVNLGTLIMALFFDLATEKSFTLPTQAEKRERKLLDLIKKRKKPVVLFIDEAHDLHGQTLIGIKRLIELVQDGGATLSVVLAGHPKLKNDLRRSSMEEIGSRATIFELPGIEGHKQEYALWLLQQCSKSKTKTEDILTDEAVAVLVEKLRTPLQFEHYMTLAIEEAFRVGEKPVSADVVSCVLARDIENVEASLTRQGYNQKALAVLLNLKPAQVRSFLHGDLSPGRTKELNEELLASGIPL